MPLHLAYAHATPPRLGNLAPFPSSPALPPSLAVCCQTTCCGVLTCVPIIWDRFSPQLAFGTLFCALWQACVPSVDLTLQHSPAASLPDHAYHSPPSYLLPYHWVHTSDWSAFSVYLIYYHIPFYCLASIIMPAVYGFPYGIGPYHLLTLFLFCLLHTCIVIYLLLPIAFCAFPPRFRFCALCLPTYPPQPHASCIHLPHFDMCICLPLLPCLPRTLLPVLPYLLLTSLFYLCYATFPACLPLWTPCLLQDRCLTMPHLCLVHFTCIALPFITYWEVYS